MEVQEKWGKLTDEHRKQLLDRYRDADVHDEWYRPTYDSFGTDMEAIGVYVDRVHFSGFWSQGDGACFDGHVGDWGEFLAAVGKPELADFVMEHGPSFSWASHGRYCHEHTVEFGVNGLVIENPHDENYDPLRHAAWEAAYGEYGPLHSLGDDFIEFLRDKMRDLYRTLEEEYEYLTSDEEVTTFILDACEDEIEHLLAEQDEEAQTVV